MSLPNVTDRLAYAFSLELWEAWKDWAIEYSLTLVGAFPGFVAFPSGHAPTMPTTPPVVSFAPGYSPQAYRLNADVLAPRILEQLRTILGSSAQTGSGNPRGSGLPSLPTQGLSGIMGHSAPATRTAPNYNVPVVATSPDDAVWRLANWVQQSFRTWKTLASLTNLFGEGPIPTYAPPYTPVGPVANGTLYSVGSLFGGFRFPT